MVETLGGDAAFSLKPHLMKPHQGRGEHRKDRYSITDCHGLAEPMEMPLEFWQQGFRYSGNL